MSIDEPQPASAEQPLSAREIDMALRELKGWSRREGGLRRRVRRSSFEDAVAFVNEVAVIVADANHHPDIDIRYRHVILFLTTHEAGGVTDLDINLARQINAIA